MSTTITAPVSSLETSPTVEQLDDDVRREMEVIDDAKPAKLSKADRKAREEEARLAKETEAKSQREAERNALQALVPWKVVETTGYYNNQKGEIDQWADDLGQYPRNYRSYSRDEWGQAIGVLAAAVNGLAESHPDYQRTTGLYVEEHTIDLLLIKAKKWQLLIQVPTKSSPAGKKFELKDGSGQAVWGSDSKREAALAELLADYIPEDNREMLLNICCQYLRGIRIRVNRAVWGAEHPELAHLLEEPKR